MQRTESISEALIQHTNGCLHLIMRFWYCCEGSDKPVKICRLARAFATRTNEVLEGGPSIPYPFNYFVPKINMANIPENSEIIHGIPISLKLIQVSRIPLIIYKNIPFPFKFLANIPVSLKTLPGPHKWHRNHNLDHGTYCIFQWLYGSCEPVQMCKLTRVFAAHINGPQIAI